MWESIHGRVDETGGSKAGRRVVVDGEPDEEVDEEGEMATEAGEMPSSSLISFSSITSRRFSLVMGMGPLRSYDSLDQVRNSSTVSSSKRTRTARSSPRRRGMEGKSRASEGGSENWEWEEAESESEGEKWVSSEREASSEMEVERGLRQGRSGRECGWVWMGWKRVSSRASSQHSDGLGDDDSCSCCRDGPGDKDDDDEDDSSSADAAEVASMSANRRSSRSSGSAGVCWRAVSEVEVREERGVHSRETRQSSPLGDSCSACSSAISFSSCRPTSTEGDASRLNLVSDVLGVHDDDDGMVLVLLLAEKGDSKNAEVREKTCWGGLGGRLR